MTALELLQQARTKIERGWTQGWFARDSDDKRVDIGSDQACKFCLSGALYSDYESRSWPNSWSGARKHLLRNLSSDFLKSHFGNLADFNDDPGTKKEDVLKLINLAIEDAKKDSLKRAVCVLIEHPISGLVLCVSRGDNLQDWGLPGGKVEPGETLLEAAIRELREETAICLNGSQLSFVRERICTGETDYQCTCFRTTDRNLAHYIYEMKCHRSSSEGTVAWRKWSDLVSSTASFREYNLDLLVRLREMDHVKNS